MWVGDMSVMEGGSTGANIVGIGSHSELWVVGLVTRSSRGGGGPGLEGGERGLSGRGRRSEASGARAVSGSPS